MLFHSIGVLDTYPDTLLGDSEKREKYHLKNEILFFHRHPTVFSYILYYYIQGFTQRPSNIPSDIFIEECRFFSIPFQYDEDENLILHFNELPTEEISHQKSFHFFSFLISLFSCLVLFFNHLPKSDFIYNQLIYNSIFSNSFFSWIDMSCSIWFMIEFYIRFIFSQESTQNFQLFIDIISIAPIFFSLLIHVLSHWFPYLSILYPFYICLKSFRVLRLIRYIPKFDLIVQTLYLSSHIFSITFILSSLFIIPLGIIIYLLERTDPSSTITDPNIGLSWAIETLTTIGFGEYIPHTYQGRCLSIFTCIFGLIILAIPIPIVFRKFQIIYQNSLKKELWRKSLF